MTNTLKNINYVFPRMDLSKGNPETTVQKTFNHLLSMPALYFGEGLDPMVQQVAFDPRLSSSVLSYSQPRPVNYIIPAQYLLNPDKFKIHVVLFAQLRAGSLSEIPAGDKSYLTPCIPIKFLDTGINQDFSETLQMMYYDHET